MSITNFYYFDKVKLGNILQKIDLENAVVADFDMKIIKTWSGLPFGKGKSLLELFHGEEERLFTIVTGMSELIRAHVESEPFDTELTCANCGYLLTLPEYVPLEEARYSELERLSSHKLPGHIRECADAYRRLITNEAGPLFTGGICSVMERIRDIVNVVRRDMMQAPIIRDKTGTGLIKYSEKDFFRLIITAVSVCLSMSGRDDIKMQCRIGKFVAGFGSEFNSPLPTEIINFIINGQYDVLSFNSEYGSIFLMLSYMKRLCLLYGYSFAVEPTSAEHIALRITIPFVTEDDAPSLSFKERFNKEWALAIAKLMLLHDI